MELFSVITHVINFVILICDLLTHLLSFISVDMNLYLERKSFFFPKSLAAYPDLLVTVFELVFLRGRRQKTEEIA